MKNDNKNTKLMIVAWLSMISMLSMPKISNCQNENITNLFEISNNTTKETSIDFDYDIEADGVYYKVISLDDYTLRAVGLVDNGATSAHIPDSLTFSQLTFRITEIDFEEDYDNLQYFSFPNILDYLHLGRNNINELTANATNISGFDNCPNLKYVSLIGNVQGFNDCPNLEIAILDGDIDGFADCRSLKHVEIGALTSLVNIYSFRNCHINRMELLDGSEELLLKKFYDNDYSNYLVDTLYCGRNLNTESYIIDGLIDVTFGPDVTLYYASMLEPIKKWEVFNESFITVHGRFHMDNCKIEELGFDVKTVLFDYYYHDYYYYSHISRWLAFPLLKKVYFNSPYISMPTDCNKSLQFTFGYNTVEIYGNDATIIGDSAFIKMESCVPPYLATDFSVQTYLYTTLYVPQGTLEEYRNADGWKYFVNIEEFDFDCVKHTIKIINTVPDLYGIKATISEYGNIPAGNYLSDVCCTAWVPSVNYNYHDTLTFVCNPYQNICLHSGPTIHGGNNTIGCNDALCWKENGVQVCDNGFFAFPVTKDRTLSLCVNPNAYRTITLTIDSPNNSESIAVGYSYSEYETDFEQYSYNYYSDHENRITVYRGVDSYTTRIRMRGTNVRYWSGDISQNGNTLDFVLNRDYNITAHCTLGVDDETDSGIYAFAMEDRTIKIIGLEEACPVSVYNIKGQCVYKGKDNTIKVTSSGLYLVAVENNLIKVMVQ